MFFFVIASTIEQNQNESKDETDPGGKIESIKYIIYIIID